MLNHFINEKSKNNKKVLISTPTTKRLIKTEFSVIACSLNVEDLFIFIVYRCHYIIVLLVPVICIAQEKKT